MPEIEFQVFDGSQKQDFEDNDKWNLAGIVQFNQIVVVDVFFRHLNN